LRCNIDDATGLARGVPGGELTLVRSFLLGLTDPGLYEADWGFAKSVHAPDPDGDEIEGYIDTSHA
jgi:hypothetical protein